MDGQSCFRSSEYSLQIHLIEDHHNFHLYGCHLCLEAFSCVDSLKRHPCQDFAAYTIGLLTSDRQVFSSQYVRSSFCAAYEVEWLKRSASYIQREDNFAVFHIKGTCIGPGLLIRLCDNSLLKWFLRRFCALLGNIWYSTCFSVVMYFPYRVLSVRGDLQCGDCVSVWDEACDAYVGLCWMQHADAAAIRSKRCLHQEAGKFNGRRNCYF